jgi:type VI secretion system secreted protein VgrG
LLGLDGQYVLTGVTHAARAPHDRSGGLSFRYANTFTCIPVRLPFRPPRVTPRPVIPGTQTAVVAGSGAPGEEIFTDRYGRVKVNFPWESLNAKPASSCWVRVAQVWAGKNWGASFWPRIGQEVIVAFLDGDPDRPIIVGSVYNEAQRPPYLGSAKFPGRDPSHPNDPWLSGIRTNSTPGGGGFNELRFDDKKDKEEIYVHAQRDLHTQVEHDQTTTVHHNRTDRIDADDSESVGKSQALSVGGGRSKTVGGDESASIGGNQTLSVGKDRSRSVRRLESVSVAGDQIVVVSGGRTANVGKTQSVTVTENDFLNVGKGRTVIAGEAITLICGAASLSLSQDGTIVLRGGNITVEGSGTITAQAKSSMTLKGKAIESN